SPKTDSEFAQILYLALRSADEKNLSTIIVRQPTNSGIAVAIRDRLKRAVNRG
ncbi:MAG: Sua5 family C-terminal domain-containing protein, partial [bacterium]